MSVVPELPRGTLSATLAVVAVFDVAIYYECYT
jgi:hypothetical protein